MNEGDYEVRSRGLEALFRVRDLVEWDILRAEMAAGVSDGRVGASSTPYIILHAFCGLRGVSIGAECEGWAAGHVMGYLASAIVLRGVSSRPPILVVTAVEELLGLRAMYSNLV